MTCAGKGAPKTSLHLGLLRRGTELEEWKQPPHFVFREQNYSLHHLLISSRCSRLICFVMNLMPTSGQRHVTSGKVLGVFDPFSTSLQIKDVHFHSVSATDTIPQLPGLEHCDGHQASAT